MPKTTNSLNCGFKSLSAVTKKHQKAQIYFQNAKENPTYKRKKQQIW